MSSYHKKNIEEKPRPKWLSWTYFIVVTVLYLLFLYWVESWWGLIVVPFIFDVYITKKIRWTWWKELENPISKTLMSWVDAIVFALVAVYFVNNFFFELPDTLFFSGEILAYRRLSSGFKAELRTAHTADTTDYAAYTTYTAGT